MNGNHDHEYATSAVGAANANASQEFNDAVRADALIHATLAVAYEQRTANLIAAYNAEVSGQGRIKGDGIAIDRHNEILDRLGL